VTTSSQKPTSLVPFFFLGALRAHRVLITPAGPTAMLPWGRIGIRGWWDNVERDQGFRLGHVTV
jgi:hypothetical protein